MARARILHSWADMWSVKNNGGILVRGDQCVARHLPATYSTTTLPPAFRLMALAVS